MKKILTTTILAQGAPPHSAGEKETAKKLLQGTATLWFIIALIGQWIFVYYVATYFGGLLIDKGVLGMKGTHLPHGYVEGDMFGNVAIAMHVLLTIIIMGFGPLQLIPWIRKNFPQFHRVNGRVYLLPAYLTSFIGLYMVLTRGVIGGIWGHIAISLDGILIIIFATVTLRYALARKIVQHRRWALRLFMVVSAVWFFRVGLMGWFVLTGGVGIDKETFTGPFITFISLL
ncbi:MAG: DUF2306 domain-containing protein [Proteobacteria bacterium]|nr:DUF2306 domain-containing protein [Pseudomonadota bacterium]